MELPPYVVLEKAVGQTPLVCAEQWRQSAGVDTDVPLAYAGRLDPMASGKLLVLIGDECKNQTNYHNLDKAYDFSVLLGIGSDTHDVLGRLCVDNDEPLQSGQPPAGALRGARPSLTPAGGCPSRRSLATKTNVNTPYPHQAIGQMLQKQHSPNPGAKRVVFAASDLEVAIKQIASELVGNIELPYPHFSAKTVQGKPLHMWTLEGRLDEIEIPTKESTIYSLQLTDIETKTREQVCDEARAKIDTIPPVTEARKALGNDFRRTDVRKDWEHTKNSDNLPDEYTIAHLHCIASSGTYMRTLAKVIGQKLDTQGLAWHIHRTDVGDYGEETRTWNRRL